MPQELGKQTQVAQAFVSEHRHDRSLELAIQFREYVLLSLSLARSFAHIRSMHSISRATTSGRFISKVALNVDDWAKIVALTGGEERKFMPGQTIITETDPFECVFYIANGEVSIERAGLKSHILSPGGVIGLLEFLGNKKAHLETCVAYGTSVIKLFAVPAAKLERFLYPTLSMPADSKGLLARFLASITFVLTSFLVQVRQQTLAEAPRSFVHLFVRSLTLIDCVICSLSLSRV